MSILRFGIDMVYGHSYDHRWAIMLAVDDGAHIISMYRRHIDIVVVHIRIIL